MQKNDRFEFRYDLILAVNQIYSNPLLVQLIFEDRKAKETEFYWITWYMHNFLIDIGIDIDLLAL